MARKKAVLDKATIEVVQRILALPPKPHDEMKVGRPASEKGNAMTDATRDLLKKTDLALTEIMENLDTLAEIVLEKGDTREKLYAKECKEQLAAIRALSQQVSDHIFNTNKMVQAVTKRPRSKP